MIESIIFKLYDKSDLPPYHIVIPINEIKYYEYVGLHSLVRIHLKSSGEIEIYKSSCQDCHEKLKEIFKEKE
jgi:hypothetical protein